MTTWHTQCWDGILVENVTWQCDATNAEMELLLSMPRDNVTQPMRDQNIVDSALWQCDTTNAEMELLLRTPHDNVTQLTPRWNYCWGHHGIMWHNKHWDGIIVENAMWQCDASNTEMELLLRKSYDNVTHSMLRWTYCWGHHVTIWHNQRWDGIIVENAM